MSVNRQIDEKNCMNIAQLEAVKVQNYKLKLDIQVDKERQLDRQIYIFVNRQIDEKLYEYCTIRGCQSSKL